MSEDLTPAFYKPTAGKPRPCLLLSPESERITGCSGRFYRVRPCGHTKGFTFYHESRVFFEKDLDIVSNKGVRRIREKEKPCLDT